MQPSTPEPSPLRRAQRCLARTRRGTPCQSPATRHGRCRMHGGAPGTGAPKGERMDLGSTGDIAKITSSCVERFEP